MAKKKEAVVDATACSSAMLDAMVGNLNKSDIQGFNVGVSMSNDVGIPFPALSLRYLFQMTALPLSRLLQIVGEEGSAKSALLTEVASWVLEYDGIYVYAENENKDTRNMRSSIFKWHPKKLANVIDLATDSLESWQTFIGNNIQFAKNIQLKKDGPGRTVPMIFGIDSLTGTAPEALLNDIEKDGFAKRTHPVMANLIAQWLRGSPRLLKDYPFLLVATNHLKPGTDARGLPTYSIPGGKGFKFMETFEIEMRKIRDIDKMAAKGLRVRLKSLKNSAGPGRKTIEANLLWKIGEDAEGNFRQFSAWDWHTASIEMLMKFDTEAYMRNAIRDACGIQVASVSKCLAYSEKLGVPKDSPISFYAMSQLLEQHPDILKALYKILHITPCAHFVPGVCFMKQREAATKAVATDVSHRYAQMELLPAMSGDELHSEASEADGIAD